MLIAAFHVRERRQPELPPNTLLPRLKNGRLKEALPEIFRRLTEAALPVVADDEERIGVTNSFPDWMVRILIQEYGTATAEQMCVSLNDPAPLTLRVNTLCTTRDACRETLRTQGIETTPTAYSPFGLIVPRRVNIFSIPAFKEGLFEVQDEGSQLLPLLIDPKPTVKLLDACAGAGGKTLEFAALMKNRGEIVAADVNAFRLGELKKRARRASASNIRIREVDGLTDLVADHRDFFDVVFVDAPCSGIGTIRRNPGMKWKVVPSTVNEVSQKQAAIMNDCAALVKPGGRLVYATCTMFRQENEAVIEAFLGGHPEFARVDLSGAASRVGLAGAVSDGYFRLLPQDHGTDGFFCAVLMRQQAG
jgi:16S rRNA (cytosine967-C5)-methyltransferase